MAQIARHQDLKVYQAAFSISMELFELSKTFPKEETYSLTDQIRRSSRSVCSNLAEAFRKRKYPKAFIAKIADCEGEAAETQVWIAYSSACEYVLEEVKEVLSRKYDKIIAQLVTMRNHPEKWSR